MTIPNGREWRSVASNGALCVPGGHAPLLKDFF